MRKFRVYPSQLIHYGRPDRKPNALAGWDWVSLCGRELVGREIERAPAEWEPVCTRCKAVFAKDQATYRYLVEKYS